MDDNDDDVDDDDMMAIINNNNHCPHLWGTFVGPLLSAWQTFPSGTIKTETDSIFHVSQVKKLRITETTKKMHLKSSTT